jgi:hypothetical protein
LSDPRTILLKYPIDPEVLKQYIPFFLKPNIVEVVKEDGPNGSLKITVSRRYVPEYIDNPSHR